VPPGGNLTWRSVERDLRYENCSGQHRFPVQMTASIFSGTSSFLNFSGIPATRCGMCRSPMSSTSIALPRPTTDTEHVGKRKS
jgi:hypothetical protein